MKKIAILGGGSWGTALALVLSRSRARHTLALWVHDQRRCEIFRRTRQNDTYLPGFELPAEIGITHDLGTACTGADIILGVIPAAHARAVYSEMLPYVTSNMVFVSATKGLEPGSHARMSEVLAQVVSQHFPPRVAALSGPSFANEVARGDATAVVVASRDPDLARAIREEFSGPTFRLYSNNDLVGVELGGALKNVIALAAGICHGLGLGANALAALITRGLAEITRLAVAAGGRLETLSGLAGMGDLVLTCTGELSRNRAVGIELGKGRKLAEILANMRMVAEGVSTTSAALDLAHAAGVEMPITEQMNAVLREGRAPGEAIREMMERPLRQE
jgi:glycerol-3-phosphate dehydrogenase (NAD(P)+)